MTRPRMQTIATLSCVLLTVTLASTACAPLSTPTPATQLTATVAPTQAAPTVTPEPAERGELSVGFVEVAAGHLDPMKAVAPPLIVVYPAFSDALMRLDVETGELEPTLAVSWEHIDERTLEVKLRQGVKFHNGEDFDANAVKFSFERALDPDLALSITSRVQNVTDVTVVDRYTVRIGTEEPDPLLLKRLTALYMVPPKYVAEVGESEFGMHPVGTGPFRLVRHLPGQEIVFEAWDEGWRGPPKLERLTFVSLPEDAARVSALLAGDVDLIYAVPPDQADRLQEAGRVVEYSPKGHVYMLRFDWMTCDCPLEDKRVRQAINYAIDKEALIEHLFSGMTEETPGQFFLPFAFGFNPDIEPYPYDPQEARALLAEAGYTNGFEARMMTTDGRVLLDKALAEALAGYLEDVGIRTQIDVVESAEYISHFHNPDSRKRGLVNSVWAYLPILDPEFALIWNVCSQPRKLHCDPKFDEVFIESQTEMDPVKRRLLLQKAIAVMRENPPAAFLFAVPDIYAFKSEVEGVKPRPDGLLWFEEIEVLP
ncbi:MAG: ABC transporter substrate-binding protein [bacterium]